MFEGACTVLLLEGGAGGASAGELIVMRSLTLSEGRMEQTSRVVAYIAVVAGLIFFGLGLVALFAGGGRDIGGYDGWLFVAGGALLALLALPHARRAKRTDPSGPA